MFIPKSSLIHSRGLAVKEHLPKVFGLLNLLLDYDGAMIVAGDFNNWTSTRTTLLQRFVDTLKLHAVELDIFHQKNIKSVFGYSIDNMFYRGLDLIEAKTINSGRFSDHTPIYAKFSSK